MKGEAVLGEGALYVPDGESLVVAFFVSQEKDRQNIKKKFRGRPLMQLKLDPQWLHLKEVTFLPEDIYFNPSHQDIHKATCATK